MCMLSKEIIEAWQNNHECELTDDKVFEPDDADNGNNVEIEKATAAYLVKNINGEKVTSVLSTDGIVLNEGEEYLDKWYDNCTLKEFCDAWRKHEADIKRLVRYPGGMHEWLMVSTLLELKYMNIPMQIIKSTVTPTSECRFYVDKKECWHGHAGSGWMHARLFEAIVVPPYKCSTPEMAREKLKENLIGACLALWMEEDEIPQCLKDCIDNL